jgi:hypothetical protein
MGTSQGFVLILIFISLIPLIICIKKKEETGFSILGIMLFGLLIILGLIFLISFKPFIVCLTAGMLTVIFVIELIRELIEFPKID